MSRFSKKSKRKEVALKSDILISTKQSFMFTEAFKSLRTNIMFSLAKEGCKRIMVVSSVASEGKSTISAHLAVSLADMGSSVLVIDCDLRRGKAHKFFEAKRSPGLANVLAGFTDVITAVQKTSIDKLYVLSAGVVPPNPSELLASERMKMLIDEFSKSFDYIIMDTSPVNVVSDALAIAPLVDGVAVVARQNYTDKKTFEKCINSLEFAGAKIIGVVLNDAQEKRTSYTKKYGSYYKSGYYASARRYYVDDSK